MSDFSIFHWLVAGFIIFLIYSFIAPLLPAKRTICKACGHQGSGKLKTRGNIAIEIILWLCLIIPGLIYSIWRISTRYRACELCGSTELIPLHSPIGQKLVAAQEKTPK